MGIFLYVIKWRANTDCFLTTYISRDMILKHQQFGWCRAFLTISKKGAEET